VCRLFDVGLPCAPRVPGFGRRADGIQQLWQGIREICVNTQRRWADSRQHVGVDVDVQNLDVIINAPVFFLGDQS